VHKPDYPDIIAALHTVMPARHDACATPAPKWAADL